MGKIHVLPEHIANKIAAGEVVERPASIVKELIENSLDAGADYIEVEIAHGGKSLIRVSDNGCGMSREDACLAFARHATSKISSAEDLERILSFGFRGEALPSIAAVSRIALSTGINSRETAVHIGIEGGVEQVVSEHPPRQGTSVEIRDLFFNTPARRKFLKADVTEKGHVQDLIAHLSLAHPNVHFVFKVSEKTVYDLPPVRDLRLRAEAIWGAEISRHLLEIRAEGQDGLRVSGFIGKPFVARGNRGGQILFLNRRWIKSNALSYALQDGFYGLLIHGKYPLAIVFIEVDPETVDVNVHPTKQEVKISNESEVRSLLKKAVVEALLKESDLAPQVLGRARNFPAANTEFAVPALEARVFAPAVLNLREPAAVYTPQQEAIPISVRSDAAREKLRVTRIYGQIHQTFIVAETEEGMLLIDQHAAHERVMFEALSRNMKSGKPEKQNLLMDEVLSIHPKQVEILTHFLPLLNQVGFEIETFGKQDYVLRAYPALLGNENPAVFIKDFLDEKEAGKMGTSLEQYGDEVAALIACKRKSVRAHDSLTPSGAQVLLERLAACDNPFSCPHGRPSMIKYSVSDLERLFQRKV